MKGKCFVCDRPLGKNPHVAVTSDGQRVFVGSECFKNIGKKGWQPEKDSPRLYRGRFAPDGTLLRVIGLERSKYEK